jgi:hypothetical protein
VGSRDTDTSTQANSSPASSTPAHSTGALSEVEEIVVAFAALHGNGTGNQSAPVWSAGFASVFDAPAVTGAGSTHSTNWVAVATGQGLAAAEPSVSWSGDTCSDRYMLTVSYRRTLVTVEGAAALGPLAAVASVTVTEAAVVASGGGGWNSLLTVVAEARSIAAEESTRVPTACPNDGEPLRQGPSGVLYCPYDGWQP